MKGHFKTLRINTQSVSAHSEAEDILDSIKAKAHPGTMKVTWLSTNDPGGIYLWCIIEWCDAA